MNGLGWNKFDVKWGGAGHARVIWTHPGYTIDSGKLYGPDCDGLALEDCTKQPKYSDEVEFI